MFIRVATTESNPSNQHLQWVGRLRSNWFRRTKLQQLFSLSRKPFEGKNRSGTCAKD